MSPILQTALDSDVSQLIEPSHFSNNTKQQIIEVKVRFQEIKRLLKRSIEIANVAQMPLGLVKRLEGVVENYNELFNVALSTLAIGDENKFLQTYTRIASYHNNFFEISSSNNEIATINAINNYSENFDITSSQRMRELNSELENKNRRVDEILQRLENPSAEKVLATYAEVYKTEENTAKQTANTWLLIAVITTVAFLSIAISATVFEWLPIKMKLLKTINRSEIITEIINIPSLLTKGVVISVIIYIIVFCFRQYAINSHLKILNQQRKNALNSFTLFDAAIGEKDSEARKVLLMSLAKTIHEGAQTGFLPLKDNDHPFNQYIDINKLGNLSTAGK